jgi:hypothetical protein
MVELIDGLIYFKSLNLRRKINETSTVNVSRLLTCGFGYVWMSSDPGVRIGEPFGGADET